MSALVLTIALWVVGCSLNPLPGANAEVCEWVKSENTNIAGGTLEPSATDVQQCQKICLSKGDCKSVDWDDFDKCWLFKTTEGQKYAGEVTHYDYICNADPCSSGPCQNGGVCRVGSSSSTFLCSCVGGYSGPTCDIAPPDPCRSSPCKNGGACSVGSSFDTFECDCESGFTGTTCEIAPPGPCSRNPCKNGGECSVGSSFDKFLCDCVDDFSGPTCEVAPPDPCSSSPCKNGGDCYVGSTPKEFECDCMNDFTGKTCEIAPNPDEPDEPDDDNYPGCRRKEIVRNPKAAQCLHSNYPGRIMDLYNKPGGFSWEYRLPRFHFDWPADLRHRRITRMSFGRQTNLNYYRAVIIHGNNRRFETKSVKGALVFEGAITSIKRVLVFFAPQDMEEELTITGFQIRHCPARGACEPREIFARIRNVGVAFQGPVRSEPQIRAGGLNWKTSMMLPYVDVDVNCYGYNEPEIIRIGIEAINRGYRTNVKIWKNGRRVPIANRLGVITEYFNFRPGSPTNVNSMRFKRKAVYGDKIRVKFIPPPESVKGIRVVIWWRSFFVQICN